MSDLEEQVNPLLTPAIRGLTTNWTTDEEKGIVARWAFKTALMTDRTNRTKYWTTPDKHFKYLYEHLEPPPSVAIYLTRYVPSDGEVAFLAWVGSSWAILGGRNWNEYKAYRITFNVGHVIFQVFGYLSRDDEILTYEPQILRDNTPIPDLFRRLWPLAPGVHEWPPPGGHFDTSGLHLLGRGTP